MELEGAYLWISADSDGYHLVVDEEGAGGPALHASTGTVIALGLPLCLLPTGVLPAPGALPGAGLPFWGVSLSARMTDLQALDPGHGED